MSDLEEAVRLKFQMENQGDIISAKAKIVDLRKSLLDGKVSWGEYKAQLADATAHLKNLSQQAPPTAQALDSVNQAANRAAAGVTKVEQATTKAGSKVANLGQVGLQTGRVIQDFTQGGVAGILNNIEGLSMAVGGGPGLAGALTGLGVAFFILKPIISNFMKSMVPEDVSKYTTELDHLDARLKALTDKPTKIDVEIREMRHITRVVKERKEDEQHAEAEEEKRSLKEKEAGAQVAKVLDEEAPHAFKAVEDRMIALNKAAIAARVKQLEAQAQFDKEREGDVAKAGNLPLHLGGFDPEEEAKRLTRMAEDQGKAEAGGLSRRARAGDPVAIAALKSQLQAAGQGNLAGQLDSATPEKIKAVKAENLMWENLHRETLAAGKKEDELRKAEHERLNKSSELQKELDDTFDEARRQVLTAEQAALQKLLREQEAAIAKEREAVKRLADQFAVVFDPAIMQRMFFAAQRGTSSGKIDDALVRMIADKIGRSPLAGLIAPEHRAGVAMQMVAGQRAAFDAQRGIMGAQAGFDVFAGPQQRRGPRRARTNAQRLAATQADRARRAAMFFPKPDMKKHPFAMGPSKEVLDAAKPGPTDARIAAEVELAKATSETKDEMVKLRKSNEDLRDAIQNGKMKVQL